MITPQEQLEAIKKACQAANPDLMKLQLGCQIQYKDRIGTLIREYPIAWEVLYKNFRLFPVWKDVQNDTLANAKILGREPQLFDIKLLLEYNGYAIEEHFLDIVKLWTQPDKLSSQSQQCIDLISKYVYKNG